MCCTVAADSTDAYLPATRAAGTCSALRNGAVLEREPPLSVRYPRVAAETAKGLEVNQYTDWLGQTRGLRNTLAPEGGWLLVEEVMAMLGVSKQRVSFLVKQGRLPAKRLGHRLLIA